MTQNGQTGCTNQHVGTDTHSPSQGSGFSVDQAADSTAPFPPSVAAGSGSVQAGGVDACDHRHVRVALRLVQLHLARPGVNCIGFIHVMGGNGSGATLPLCRVFMCKGVLRLTFRGSVNSAVGAAGGTEEGMRWSAVTGGATITNSVHRRKRVGEAGTGARPLFNFGSGQGLHSLDARCMHVISKWLYWEHYGTSASEERGDAQGGT